MAYRAFVSSTFEDLKAHRAHVIKELRRAGIYVDPMEDWTAAAEEPKQFSVQRVRGCDVCVLLVGFRRGYVPDSETLSITQMEYEAAIREGVDVIPFIAQEDVPWPPQFYELEKDPALKQWRAELRQKYGVEFFSYDPESVDVPPSIARWLQELVEKVQIDLEVPHQHFVKHMRLFAGARSEQDALKRYFALRLQATRSSQVGVSAGSTGDLPVGTWTDLVAYPGQVLLTGEAGSGKTTLLLREAQRLSRQSRDILGTPLPIYLSLKTYAGGDADTLLEMAADSAKIDYRTLRVLWSEPRRPICLLLDGGDETAYRDKLVDAILQLSRALARVLDPAKATRQEARSLVVACRPGPLHSRMLQADLSWRELLLMPLRDADINAMLTRFEAASLIPFLSERLRQTVRQPDLLSALAQSALDRPVELLPHNAAEIYDLYFRHIFKTAGGEYDYERIKRPLLGRIAYNMLRNNQTAVACDDALYEWMASDLEKLYKKYYRRRRVMPYDWSAEDLHDELLRSPVVDMAAGRGEMLTFSKALYRDYFVAVYLEMLAVSSQEVRDLLQGFSNGEQLQPLSFLLEMNPEAATLFDYLPATALSAATQIWLEDARERLRVPETISNGYQQKCEIVQSGLFNLGDSALQPDQVTGLHDTNPRKRFEAVSALAELRPLPGLALLEAADDYHPFVRAVAQYALLHAGDPCSSLKIRFDEEHFIWHSYGGGEVRIGPLSLLRVPVPMAVDLSLSIDRLNIDPFVEDSEFAFLPMSPALFADDLFATKAAVDWLELLAYLQEIAVTSANLAHHAESRPGLVTLAQQLSFRAAGYSAMGRLLSSDLGLPWVSCNLSIATGGNVPAMDHTYTDLRHLFSRANQARTLRLAHLADDSLLEVSQLIDRGSVGGEVVGIKIDRFEGSAFDDTVEDGQRFTVINSSRSVGRIEAGTVHGIDIDRVQGSWHELPLTVHVHDSMSIEDAINCEVSSIRVHRLASGVCPWRVRASVAIRRFLNSRYYGVAIDEYEPESESGLISS